MLPLKLPAPLSFVSWSGWLGIAQAVAFKWRAFSFYVGFPQSFFFFMVLSQTVLKASCAVVMLVAFLKHDCDLSAFFVWFVCYKEGGLIHENTE